MVTRTRKVETQGEKPDLFATQTWTEPEKWYTQTQPESDYWYLYLTFATRTHH